MALAPNSSVAIGARLLQGVAGAFMISSSIAIGGQHFEGAARTRMFSLIMALAGLGMGVGPLIGGVLIHWFDWRAVFWANLPVTFLFFVNNLLVLPRKERVSRARFDSVGLILLSATVLLLVVPVSQAGEWGWLAPRTFGLLGGFCIFSVILILWERRVKDPLLDFSVLTVRGYVPASLCAFLAYFIGLGWLFLFSLYLHHVRGLNALETGLSFLPYAVAYFSGGLLSSHLGRFLGWRAFLFLGLCLLAVGVGSLSLIDRQTPFWWLEVGFALVGLGYIFANNAAMSLAQGKMPAEKSGAASGISMMIRWLGSALGIAVMTLVLHGTSRAALAEEVAQSDLHLPLPTLLSALTEDGSWHQRLDSLSKTEEAQSLDLLTSAFTHGVDRGLLVLVGCGGLGLILVGFVPRADS
tara:strand:- start:10412 stop:11644 length:1233 start_codon:yes stop_codon:yes gene_type:complete